jgi:hypothetical protein
VNRRTMTGVAEKAGGPGAGGAEHSLHPCGGCGAVFRVEVGVPVAPVDIDGVARVYCACCHDFLHDRLPAAYLAGLPGYDAEGQVINAHFPDLTPTDRRWYRGPWSQECLEAQLRGIALHLGVEPPAPLFLAS